MCPSGKLRRHGRRQEEGAALIEVSLLLAVLFLGPNPLAVKLAAAVPTPICRQPMRTATPDGTEPELMGAAAAQCLGAI